MAIPRCLDLQGRIGRRAFAFSQLPQALGTVFLALTILGMVDCPAMLVLLAFLLLSSKPAMLTVLVLAVPLGWFNLCQAVKRAHDVGFSGYACTIFLVPFFSSLLYLALLVAPGQKCENRYGARSSG